MIRKLNENDKELYYYLMDLFYHSEAVEKPVPLKHIDNTYKELMRSNEYLECFIFENEERKVTGYALISRSFSQESGGNVIWLEELFILPEFRGMGIGKEFFEFMHEELPASRYRIEVEPDNERAKDLYKKMGYSNLPYMQMVRDIPQE